MRAVRAFHRTISGEFFMKKLIVAFAFSAIAFALGAQAQTAPTTKTLSPQQQRMADCNKQANGMKGDDRKKFMSTCLSGKAPAASTAAAAPAATAAKPVSQQDKMKACNADAGSKNLKGDDRKKFMSDCLKKSSK
jgi:hypothetical protein